MSISNFFKLLPIFSLLSFMPVMATEYLKIDAHGRIVLVQTNEEPKEVMENLRPQYLMIEDEITDEEFNEYAKTPETTYKVALNLVADYIGFLRKHQAMEESYYKNARISMAYWRIAQNLNNIHKSIRDYFFSNGNGIVFLFSSSKNPESQLTLMLVLYSFLSEEFKSMFNDYRTPGETIKEFIKNYIKVLEKKENLKFLVDFTRQWRGLDELAEAYKRFEHPEEPPVIELTPRPMRTSTWATYAASLFGFSQKP
jgi:hypothetical protein